MYKVADFSDLHSELKLPKDVAAKVRAWVDNLKWPEGSDKEDRRNYHITILSIDNDDDDFREWMTDEMKGKSFDFETAGLDIFNEEFVVLRLDSDQWKNLTVAWGERAYNKGLEPRRFPGGPKAHITVGKLGEKKTKPQGIQDPGLKFTTGKFNINVNSAFDRGEWARRDNTNPDQPALDDGDDIGFWYVIQEQVEDNKRKRREYENAVVNMGGDPFSSEAQAILDRDYPTDPKTVGQGYGFDEPEIRRHRNMTPKTFLGRKQGSDLKQWLDSISEPPPQPLSPYHEAPEDFLPQKHETRPGVAAPDFKPDPYVWQDDQRTEYPEMNRIATVEPPAIAKPGQSRWDTGDCLAYANALTEEYPWLSLASAGVKEEQEEGWTPYHYFAVDPNGNAYDVTGKRTVEQLLKDNQFNYWEVTHRDYEGESDGMPDDPEVARHVIKDNQTKLLSARMSGIGFLPEQFKHGNTRRDAAIWENRVPFLLDPQGNLMVGKVGDWHADLNPDEIRQTFGLTPDQDPWGATSAYQGMAMVNLPDMEDIWQWPHAFQEVNPEAMPDAATVERVQQLVKASYDAYTQHQAKKELSEHEKAKKHWYDEAWSKNPIPEEGTEDPVKGDEDFLDRP